MPMADFEWGLVLDYLFVDDVAYELGDIVGGECAAPTREGEGPL